MIATIVLLIIAVLMVLIAAIITRALIKKQQIIGRPPIPVVFFILAKLLVMVNLAFLMSKGLSMHVEGVFAPVDVTDIIALVFLVIGAAILFLSAIALNDDLIFGLSSSGAHQLRTTGIYSVSRHPFYLGFIFILFSSCLFTPHIVNILSFGGAWIIHHAIMIKEEEFLGAQYGDEYKRYAQNVKRYITL